MAEGEVQRQVQATIDELVASRAEIGLQVAVLHRGHIVVDAVAGVADQRTSDAARTSTLFFATSTAKGVAAAVVHVLVERGALAYDQRVADVWPEFAAHGKHRVTLADVLVHTAGFQGCGQRSRPTSSATGIASARSLPTSRHGGRRAR